MAVGVLVLFWLIYPGSLLLFASLVGLCYLGAAVAAALDRRPGVWLALAFTVLAFAFSAYGVYRYVDNGFDFVAGNFPGRTGWYWPAYLFVLVALGALAVIVLHAVSWPWMLRPRGERS
ncbi:MAG TPA: hypothetical protein VF322_06095 [Gammaproteobacteria bacterium]